MYLCVHALITEQSCHFCSVNDLSLFVWLITFFRSVNVFHSETITLHVQCPWICCHRPFAFSWKAVYIYFCCIHNIRKKCSLFQDQFLFNTVLFTVSLFSRIFRIILRILVLFLNMIFYLLFF